MSLAGPVLILVGLALAGLLGSHRYRPPQGRHRVPTPPATGPTLTRSDHHHREAMPSYPGVR